MKKVEENKKAVFIALCCGLAVVIVALLFCTQVKIPEVNEQILKFEESKKALADWGEFQISLNRDRLRDKISNTDPNQTEYTKERNLILADTNKLIAETEDKINYWQLCRQQSECMATVCKFLTVILGAAMVISFFLGIARKEV